MAAAWLVVGQFALGLRANYSLNAGYHAASTIHRVQQLFAPRASSTAGAQKVMEGGGKEVDEAEEELDTRGKEVQYKYKKKNKKKVRASR